MPPPSQLWTIMQYCIFGGVRKYPARVHLFDQCSNKFNKYREGLPSATNTTSFVVALWFLLVLRQLASWRPSGGICRASCFSYLNPLQLVPAPLIQRSGSPPCRCLKEKEQKTTFNTLRFPPGNSSADSEVLPKPGMLSICTIHRHTSTSCF